MNKKLIHVQIPNNAGGTNTVGIRADYIQKIAKNPTTGGCIITTKSCTFEVLDSLNKIEESIGTLTN